jgi:hypothetical protein
LVEPFDGRRLSGSLIPDPSKQPAVHVADAMVKLPDLSVAEPFERTFWSRFDAGFDFGYYGWSNAFGAEVLINPGRHHATREDGPSQVTCASVRPDVVRHRRADLRQTPRSFSG